MRHPRDVMTGNVVSLGGGCNVDPPRRCNVGDAMLFHQSFAQLDGHAIFLVIVPQRNKLSV